MKKRKLKRGFVLGLIFALIFVSAYFLFNSTSREVPTNLELVSENLVNPVYLTESPDDSGRLFVVDRIGLVRVISSEGILVEEPFLDVRENMVNLRETFDERGLLGLAFHPDFENNGKFFVYYSVPLRENSPQGWDHTSRISEFVYEEGKVNIDSEKIVLEIDEPQFNHNGGQLLFGEDGYLYIAVGDGGNADDVGLGHPEIGNGQDKETLLGSILRIDINENSEGKNYSIPEDNPFVNSEGRDEIYAYGLRNPFRMSFDEKTGRLFVADVGQNLWEEVNIVEKGKNYGWNIMEASYCFSTENPDNSPEECPEKGYDGEELTKPILEYNHSLGVSVIGGFVYRGKEISNLEGKYVFGDWSSSFTSPRGKIFVAEEKYGDWEIVESKEIDSFVLGFGEDSEKEIYVLTSNAVGPTGNSGKVYKIIEEGNQNE